MVKNLSAKELQRRKLVPVCVKDYFGEGYKISADSFERINKALITKNFSKLEEEEKRPARHIFMNMCDEVYMGEISG